MIDYEELAEAMGDLDEDTVKELLETVMADGGSGAQQAMDACQKGMDIVGSRFESGEYFVGDLIYAGELMTDAVSILKDALVTGDGGGTKTKMILCTVKDDLHDIGKKLLDCESQLRKNRIKHDASPFCSSLAEVEPPIALPGRSWPWRGWTNR